MTTPIAAAQTTSTPGIERPQPAVGSGPWDGEEFSFEDVLDLVNPLQHLPVIGSLYRSATGDRIGAVPRIIGGALLGGPIGLILGVINAVIEGATGKDAGEHVIAMLTGEESLPSTTQYAALADPERDQSWTPPSYPATTGAASTQLALVTDHERGDTNYFPAPSAEPPSQLAAVPPAPADPGETITTTSDPLPAPLLDRVEESAALVPAPMPGPTPILPFAGPVKSPGIQLNRATGKPIALNRAALPLAVQLQQSRALPLAPAAAEKPLATAVVQAPQEPKVNWFPNQMLNALDKYQAAARLAPAAPGGDISAE
jgi:hypothetical protein